MNTYEEESDLIIFREIFGEDKDTPTPTPTPETKKEMLLKSTDDDYSDLLNKECLDEYKLNVEKDYKEIKQSLDEKKIMEIWILKNKVFKEIKDKRIERNKQLKEKLNKLKLEREKKLLTENNLKDEFYNPKLIIQKDTNKKLEKQILRNKKKKKRILKYKKTIKQIKKKNKLKKNFLRNNTIYPK
jgi:hypothetical protein